MTAIAVDFESVSIESLSRELARVYADVEIAENPLYKWLQIVNDVAVVSEEIRRQRSAEAYDRLMRVLNRVLEFAGYYLYHREEDDGTIAGFLARHFRRPLAVSGLAEHWPEEGLTRWVLAKYPFSCSKCGATNARSVGNCVCSLKPWVFEERREESRAFSKYRTRVVANQRRLGNIMAQFRQGGAQYRIGEFFNSEGLLTLPGLFRYFYAIYRAAYYSREPWKTAMHLVEEIGEVSTEIGRLHLLYSIGDSLMENDGNLWDKIAGNMTERMGRYKRRAARQSRSTADDLLASARASGSPKDELASLAAGRLKDEFADVLSWMAALACQLNPAERNRPATAKELQATWEKDGYLDDGGVRCKWCGERNCSNACLITNAVAAEIVEVSVKL